LYLALATVFVAQATGTEMSIGQQVTMVLLLMLTSKGVAGIPRATLVILLGAIANFGMPEWPVLLIMGIDELMDMARTSVNVTGNCLATAVMHVGKASSMIRKCTIRTRLWQNPQLPKFNITSFSE
jgi:proton glutamate symport protein